MKKQKTEQKTEAELDVYYAPNGVNVTARIKDGRTVIINNKKKAEKLAHSKRSYSYPVTCNGLLVGYGIPK